MEFETIEEFYRDAERWKKEYTNLKCNCFDKKEENLQKRKWKNAVYSIKCKRKWKIDKIWAYLNNDINYYELGDIIDK